MSISLKQGGVWRKAQGLYVKVGNDWKLVDKGYEKVGGVWTPFHQNLVEATISTSGVHLNAQSYFSAADWSSSTPKRLIIPAGVVIGSTNTGIPALQSNSGRGGTLEIIVDGEIQGAGGANNSGNGGPALQVLQATDLIVNGAIRSGGGGGGHGGIGGGGYYHTTEDSGEQWSQYSNFTWVRNGHGGNGGDYWWFHTFLGSTSANTLNHGGYTYHRGGHATTTYEDGSGFRYWYRIRRTRTLTHYTGGGGGGWGGVGQGYNHGNAGGNPGNPGGTNAGTGGAGGHGGGWGANGTPGANGGWGNHTGWGTPGAGGGLAGAAILGSGNVSLTNNGTINGPLA